MIKHLTRKGNYLLIHYTNKADGSFKKWMRQIGAIYDSQEKLYKLKYYANCWKILQEDGFDVPDYILNNLTKRQYLRKQYKALKLPCNITKDLFEYQIEGVKYLELGYSYLADAMGLGKTPEVLRYLELHKSNTNNLIVCPSYMKEKWKNEAKRWTTLNTQIIKGTKEKRLRNNCTYIINYEILQYHVKQLQKQNIDIMVADETHMCKNSQAIRTKSLKSIAKKTNRFIALSGTPIVNNPVEIFPILSLIDKYEFYSSILFEDKYCQMNEKYTNKYVGSKNEKELYEKLKSGVMIRRTKEDVKLELGNKFKTIVLTDMIPIKLKSYKEYNKILNDDSIDGLQKPRLLKDVIYENKKKIIFDYIDNFLLSDEKICLFFKARKHIDEFMERYKDIAIKIDGSVSTSKRFNICNKFNNDDRIKVFCGNIIACGTGLDLVGSHTVGIIDLDWNNENMQQVIARVNRFGQKSPIVNVHYFLGENTKETEEFLEKIDYKAEQFSKVINGKKLKKEDKIINLKRG